MSPTINKRKAASELVSPPPPAKRPRSEAPTSTPRAPPRSSSLPRRLPGKPLRRPSRLLSPPPVSATLAEVDTEEEIDDLLCRIQSGIDYMRKQHRHGEAVGQTTRFEVSTTTTPHTSLALTLLRRHATPVSTSVLFEVFELGVPRPDWVTQGILTGLHDPQWWVGKNASETKAGPHADEHDIKRSAAHLKGQQTKKNKKNVATAREEKIEWKLKEWMRRQAAGEKMWDGEGEEADSSEDGDRDEDEDDMLATRPRVGIGRWMPMIEKESESESENEEDIPLLRDPRYVQWRAG
ncbi:hypothetical protein EJ02DRAFT_452974 [Clathrospora elynae]|uniref:Uncharacterized protein n=1 Tax=Clathrospora elynae TaxID=706981 RepID=A0A6A5SSV2_9PLEO|nr:hypothetical protein EJ02DRAFT_452974 [Clathrospora elynae]